MEGSLRSRIMSRIALGAFAAAIGCAKVLPPLTPPEKGGASWRELSSRHVVLCTDRDEGDAREALIELEQIIVALHDIAFSHVMIEGRRVLVVHFERERDYDAFERAGTAGVLKSSLPNDLTPQPAMVVWGQLDSASRGTLQHELTHLFLRYSASWLPPWLNEGLAEYYETMAIEDGMAIVGRPMRKAQAWARTRWGKAPAGGFDMALVPIGYVPPVTELVAMDPPAFYVWTDKGRQPTLDEQRRASANYLGAFGLVHLLMHDPAYQARYDDMIDRMSKGASADVAWTGAFNGARPEDLEVAYRKHLLDRSETTTLRIPYTHPVVAIDDWRVMGPAEVHLLWARLRSWEKDTAAAAAHLAAAKALAPASAEVRYWSGLFHHRQKDLTAAIVDMEAAAGAAPDEPRYLQGLAIVYGAHMVDHPGDAEAARKEDDLMARLKVLASTGAELNTIAAYHRRRGRPDEALAFARRAVEADPGCAQCHSTLAELLFDRGQFKEAVRAQLVMLSLLPEGATARDEEQELRRYMEAARRSRAEAAPGTETPVPAAPATDRAP